MQKKREFQFLSLAEKKSFSFDFCTEVLLILQIRLEIFFSGRVFSAAKDAILFTTAKVAKVAKVAKDFCTGQRH